MKTHINWGILAPGRIAHKFAHDLLLTKNANLHAVASRSMDRAKDFAKQYGIPHAYGRYEDLISCPDLDIIYIASPHTEHCANAILCLENKIAVLCEKPLAMNIGQVENMIAAAKANDVFFMEALWTRFIPLYEETLRLLNSGIIGDIKTVRADFGFKAYFPPEHRLFNKSLGGGALLDVGIYPIFLAVNLLGKPADIKATAIFGETGVDESCGMLFKYANDQFAVLDSSIVINTDTAGYIYGDKGTMHLHGRFHHPTELTISFYENTSKYLNKPYVGNGYYHEITEVNECLLNGKKESDKMSHDFSRILMEVLDWTRREAGIFYSEIK